MSGDSIRKSATLGDLYRVKVGVEVLYVRDPGLGKTKSTPDPAKVCNPAARPPDSGERRTTGVAEQCNKTR
jgi:hypothetical protein